jgi:flagellar hook-basal body complex protein FliE
MRIETRIPMDLMPKVQITEKTPIEKRSSSEAEPSTPEAGFGELLKDVLSQVVDAQNQSAGLQQQFAAGEPIDEHTLMLAMERASLAFRLTLEVRNKVLEAYQEVMRLQV